MCVCVLLTVFPTFAEMCKINTILLLRTPVAGEINFISSEMRKEITVQVSELYELVLHVWSVHTSKLHEEPSACMCTCLCLVENTMSGSRLSYACRRKSARPVSLKDPWTSGSCSDELHKHAACVCVCVCACCFPRKLCQMSENCCPSMVNVHQWSGSLLLNMCAGQTHIHVLQPGQLDLFPGSESCSRTVRPADINR